MQRHDPRSTGATTTRSFKRGRTLALSLSALLLGTAFYASNVRAQSTLPSTNTIAVPTYEAVGLYWQSPGGTAGCEVKYRVAGTSSFAQGLPMWYDSRDGQCRGSLVGLTPNTSYEVQFNLPGQAATRGLSFRTWSNQMPVAKTVTVPAGAATFNVAESGTAAGYVVYDGKGATLDANNASQYNVTINASYVIVRGLVLKGAIQDAIRISPNVHDVIIEDNDISNWGRTRDGKWGADMDSAVRAVCTTESLVRVTVQRTRMHDPRYSANSWSDGHPAGPQGITFSYCGGNHVFRHNEIYSTTGKRFNDGMGGEDNFSKTGFPNADSDIYGNKITHTWDDGIEAEGANENVRIWGNYLDRTATGVATTVTSVGPVYIFRNVFNRNNFYERVSPDQDDRQPFFKSGSDSSLGDGRRYLFHNTMLQATQSGSSYGLGGGAGVGGTGSSQPINNTVSKNNIYHLWKPNGAMYQVGTRNEFANDLYNGNPGDAVYTSGIQGTPVYASGSGWQSEAGGMYQLAASSPGYGKGARIANFNDGAATPDVGAHQSGTAAMRFGLAASSGSAVGGSGTVVTTPPTTPPSTPPAVTGVTADKTSLTFGGSNPVSQYVKFTNTSASKVTFGTPSSTSGKFLVKNGCSLGLAPGASCQLTVSYYATRTGSGTATLTVPSDAANTPSNIALSNSATTTTAPPPPTTTAPPPSTGTTAIVPTVNALVFTTAMGSKAVSFRNTGTVAVTFSGATVSSTKFTQKNSCSMLKPGYACTAYVTYYPTHAGSKTGTLTMATSAGPVVVNISGG
jgi:hypothetical protein